MIVPTNADAKEDVNATLVDEERQSTSPETAATLKSPSDDESSDARGSDSSPTNTVNLDDLRQNCFFLFPDLKRRLSRFWILMILSVIIATSGVAGNSAATVIGAMIVAPLMMPILGTMLGIVLGDKNNFAFSFLMVILGGGRYVGGSAVARYTCVFFFPTIPGCMHPNTCLFHGTTYFIPL